MTVHAGRQMCESEIYKAQDEVNTQVFGNIERLGLEDVLLVGDTALARCYLNHRVSYDLNLFTRTRFDPDTLESNLRKIGVDFTRLAAANDNGSARQLRGFVRAHGVVVRVDFVEDIFSGMCPARTASVGGIDIITESINGLYHRKIRTVSGAYNKSGIPVGNRQKARDMFDLYVLNQGFMSLSEFIFEANRHGADIPEDGVITNLGSMPWMDLMDEIDELERSYPWRDVGMGDIRRYLMDEFAAISSRACLSPQ